MTDSTLFVQGFRAAAVKSGVRGKDRLDLGLIVSDVPAMAAGVFTTSLVQAAPVLLDLERVAGGRARAVLVNSGIANACTGEEGLRNARVCSRLVADSLGIPEAEVLVTSTGVIGMQLDMNCFERGVPDVAGQLSVDGFAAVSLAMMTTDTVPKTAVRTVIVGGKPVRLLGLAKGAGMIMPNMATLLAFVMTDAAVASAADLREWLRAGADQSFNRITVDGDTSTNDTLLLLANGLANNPPLAAGSPELTAFREALDDLLRDLAMQVVADGEGATKLVTIAVQGADNDEEAVMAARTIANSALVKTAFFGSDANWGRIIAALGRSGARFNPAQVSIRFDDVVMVENGLGLGKDAEARATMVLRRKRFTVGVDLGAGGGAAVYHTCDFSMDYVSINADYRS